ncbi:MAG: hypothetical protein QOG38_3162, partial [Hyphomicrobiales bacterium]|nr:hypothetical protein [Hyphomicrobiales bacterium]
MIGQHEPSSQPLAVARIVHYAEEVFG